MKFYVKFEEMCKTYELHHVASQQGNKYDDIAASRPNHCGGFLNFLC